MTNPDTRPDSVGQAHTPTPWLAEPADMFGDHNIVLADSRDDARAIAAVVSNMRPPKEVAANAHFIVHAVNCHDELLATAQDALQALVGVDRLLHEHGMMVGVECPAIEPLRAAIAKAKGGQP